MDKLDLAETTELLRSAGWPEIKEGVFERGFQTGKRLKITRSVRNGLPSAQLVLATDKPFRRKVYLLQPEDKAGLRSAVEYIIAHADELGDDLTTPKVRRLVKETGVVVLAPKGDDFVELDPA